MKALFAVLRNNMQLFMDWYDEIEKGGLLEIKKLTDANVIYIQNFSVPIREQREMFLNGIELRKKINLSIEKIGSERNQIEIIINQICDEKFLDSENPFFDIRRLYKQEKLGDGSFGVVYKAKSQDKSVTYAVKVSKLKVDEENRFSNQTLSIFREVKLMSLFNHPTILKFIGYSPTDFDNHFYPTIIMEFCENKTLSDLIQMEEKGLSLDGWDETKKLINIYGIASGMNYLHQHEIMHRDLKSQNILMDESLFPKIADFGLSKMIKITESSSSLNLQSTPNIKGTPLYMAPEALSDKECSKKCDVYSFAIILYEIVTNKTPFKDLSLFQLIKKVALDGERPIIDDDVPEHYKKLIEACWSQSPDDRPTFEDIIGELKNNRDFITDSVNEVNYLDFIDFVDNYESTFITSNKRITFDDFIKGKYGNL